MAVGALAPQGSTSTHGPARGAEQVLSSVPVTSGHMPSAALPGSCGRHVPLSSESPGGRSQDTLSLKPGPLTESTEQARRPAVRGTRPRLRAGGPVCVVLGLGP